MKQRVGIARALAMEPKVLLLDEPFGALDALTRAHAAGRAACRSSPTTGSTVVMVTHDVDEAVLLSDRIVMMTNGPAATIGEILEVDLRAPARPPRAGERRRLSSRCRKAVLEFLYQTARRRSRRSRPERRRTWHSTSPSTQRHETGHGRQRHGRRAHARGAAEDRARPVRHHRVRRRAASQLQPHPAVAGAGRRADARRDRAQPASGTRSNGITLHAGKKVVDDRPRAPRRRRRRRHRSAVRPPAAGHRLEPVHPAGAGQGPAGRDRLPRHRRHRRDDRRREALQARGGDRRRPARPGSRQRPDAARHGRDRGAPHAVADGAPARRRRAASCCRSRSKRAASSSCSARRRRSSSPATIGRVTRGALQGRRRASRPTWS